MRYTGSEPSSKNDGTIRDDLFISDHFGVSPFPDEVKSMLI